MNEERSIFAQPAGNYGEKSTRVPRAQVVASVVKYFLRERRHIHHRTVAKYIIDLLERMGFIKIYRDFQIDGNAALRLVQRFLNLLGYQKCLELEENDLKTAIWGRIKLYIRDHVKPMVITMAEEAGHTDMW